MTWSGFLNPFVQILLFHREPGLLIPQYGQVGSSRLTNFRQLGQRSEFFCEDILVCY